MHRYLIAFTHQHGGNGISIATFDVRFDREISEFSDLKPAIGDLTDRGFRQVQIIGFSRYAEAGNDPAGSGGSHS